MMRIANLLLAAAALSCAAPVLAADPVVEQALASGAIGEQWDGYLGFVSEPSKELKNAVDAINIKRRAAYTQVAAARNVTVDQFAQTTACSTLKAVKPGQVYKLKDGGWRHRQGSEGITPDYCG
jgi:uncharacterized protein YdbL (DUF1318 family)